MKPNNNTKIIAVLISMAGLFYLVICGFAEITTDANSWLYYITTIGLCFVVIVIGFSVINFINKNDKHKITKQANYENKERE